MRFQVNPALSWGAVFTVPAVIADRYIKLASPEQLKTLLWVLRHASEQPSIDIIAEKLSFSVEAVSEYIAYWVYEGILVSDDSAINARPSITDADKVSEAKKELPALPEVKPNHIQVLARAKESSDINELFDEAQKKFGRTLGYDGQSTLLMMHDQYGLPIEVILMLIEYCVSIHKTSNSFLAAVAKNWAEEEIDTIDKALEKIEVLQQCRSLWTKFKQSTGISSPNPTTAQSDFLRKWKYEFGFGIEMILLAYEEMADHCTKLSFPYINKVLASWHSKGYTTPEEVAEDKRKFSESKIKANKAVDDIPPASYNIDELEKRLLHGSVVYKKKD